MTRHSALSMPGVIMKFRLRIWIEACQSGYVIHPNSRNGRAQWRHLAASRAMLLTGRGLMDVHRNGQIIPKNEENISPNCSVRTTIQPSEPANGTVTKLHSTVRSLRCEHFFSEECIPMEMKRKKRDTDALICMSTIRQGNTKMGNG